MLTLLTVYDSYWNRRCTGRQALVCGNQERPQDTSGLAESAMQLATGLNGCSCSSMHEALEVDGVA